ncbi:MAG: ABC transporter permease [Candidatus Heimdallarchaeota archaeon]
MKKPVMGGSGRVTSRNQDPSYIRKVIKHLGTRRRQLGSAIVLAGRNATRSKYRSTLLILGITFTIALETGIVVSVDTLYDDFIYDNRNQNFTDITVIPKEWSDLSTLRSVSADIQTITGITRASPVYTVNVDRLIKERLPEANIIVYGIDPLEHPDITTFSITEGERKATGTNVIISQTLLSESGLNIGDAVEAADFDLELAVDLKPRSFTISGAIADPSFFGNNVGYLFILMDIQELIDVVPENERSNILKAKIDISVQNLLDIKPVVEQIKDHIGNDYLVWTGKNVPDTQANGIRAYQTAMSLVILASFVVEFLFITNILAIAIRERSSEFGIFRAVGSGSRFLILALTIELLMYSVIGSTVGLFSGITLAVLLTLRMQSFYPSLSIQSLSIHSSSLFAAISSGIVVSLISGLYPIFIVLTMPVIQNIHSRMRRKRSTKEIITHWQYSVTTGILLTVSGLILQLFVGPSPFLEFRFLSFQFLTVLLIFIGILFIEIGILVFLPKITSGFFAPVFGKIVTIISQRNIAREFQKSLLTIISSALALTFIIVVGVVSAAIVDGVPLFFKEQWGDVDLVAEAPDNQLPDRNLTDSLEQNSAILRSSFIQEERTDIKGVNSYIYGVDPAKYTYFAEDVIESIFNYTYPSPLFLSRNDAVFGLVSDLLYQRLFSPVGSDLTIRTSDNTTVNITLGAVVKSNVFLGNGEYLYISAARFQEFFNSTAAKWFVCDLNEEIESAQAIIETEFPFFQEILGIDFFVDIIEESLVLQSSMFQILFFESFILAAITQFVSILISTLHMEREVGIMRALGLSKRGVFNIFMFEAVVIGLSALTLGVFDGLVGSVLLSWYISLSIPIRIEFPLEQIITWAVFSFLITLGSTFLPSYRSSSKKIIDTISGRPITRLTEEGPPYPQVFYSYWLHSSTRDELNLNFDVQDNPVAAHEEIKKMEPHSSVSTWQFIRNHLFQIRTIFLILLGFFTFNYILEGFLIPQGLIAFDWISRIYLSILPFNVLYDQYLVNFYYFVNPYLFFIGLSIIGPIAYYFAHKNAPPNLFRLLLSGIFWGIIGCILSAVIPFLILAALIIVVAPISLYVINVSADNPLFTVPILISVVIFGAELLLFQKVWAYLVFEGISSGMPLEEKFQWLRELGAQGQIKFAGLLLLHQILQALLISFFQPLLDPLKSAEPIPFLSPFSQLPTNPIVFIFLASFEIIFFLSLILYQILQFQQLSYRFPPTAIVKRRKMPEQSFEDRNVNGLLLSE